jgi:hypothetical protein
VPDLGFRVCGVEPAWQGFVPLLQFRLGITCASTDEEIHAIILRIQIQLAVPRRSYGEREKERLVELFGQPSQWSRTLRNRLWAQVSTSVGTFKGATETTISVPCSFDLNVASTKYFQGLEEGEVPLLFLFSGTVFHPGPGGSLTVHQIPWEKECSFQMPLRIWQELMQTLFPNTAWLTLNCEMLERLYQYRRLHGLATWEGTIERLLPVETPLEVLK